MTKGERCDCRRCPVARRQEGGSIYCPFFSCQRDLFQYRGGGGLNGQTESDSVGTADGTAVECI